MTDAERLLLLLVARLVAADEDREAEKLGTTSNGADEIRKLIKDIRL